jgi:hypothetical protein
MYLNELIETVRRKGIELMVEGEKLRFYPQSAITPEMLDILRQNKQQIIVYLIRQQGGLVSLYNNPPECHNPFTPHSAHELPWECDPNTCHCYQVYGYPRLCQGVPCRWVWPQN